jgi:hypothetical protein
MKATIDFDDTLYRRLKVEAARRGRTIRELVDEGVRYVLNAPVPPKRAEPNETDWFGSLRKYAGNAESHDLASMRDSVARKRKIQ